MDTLKWHAVEYAPPRATEAQLAAARAKLVRVSEALSKRLYRSRIAFDPKDSGVTTIPVIDHVNFQAKHTAIREGSRQYDELAVALFVQKDRTVYLTATAKIAIAYCEEVAYRGTLYASPTQLTAFELKDLTLADLEAATKKIAKYLGPIGRLRHF